MVYKNSGKLFAVCDTNLEVWSWFDCLLSMGTRLIGITICRCNANVMISFIMQPLKVRLSKCLYSTIVILTFRVLPLKGSISE